MLKKRTGVVGSSGRGAVVPGKCDLAEAYPSIWEHLSADAYPDKSPRQTGTVLFLFEAGLFKAAVIDRDASLTAFVSGETIRAVLNAIEAGLDEDRLEWRASKARPPRR